jgi:hypothetical protein
MHGFDRTNYNSFDRGLFAVSTSTTSLDLNTRNAFARVCTDNPKLTISGYYIPCLPPPFTAQEIDLYTPMFCECLAWIKAFHAAAPATGAGVESDLARDAMMSWRRLRGVTEHVALGVFTAAAIHLGIAGPRRRGRADVWISLRLSTILTALDHWSGPDRFDDDAPLAIEAVTLALEKLR